MILPKSSYFVAAFLAARLDPPGVRAHGYLKTPRSRNYFASVDPIWWGGTENDPAPENCPHCLNIGGTEARCGKVGDHDYDAPPNAIGGTLAPIIQACYAEGTVIDVESVLTAHHKGHFEVKACPVAPGEVPTQACFDAHKLTFVEDEMHGAPPDPLFPERAYIPLAENSLKEPNGNYIYKHRYKLPEGLRGDLILLQWYYVTANSCSVEGYDTYDFPPGFDPGTSTCEYVAPDGRGLPEQFWNCAEVRIASDCGTDQPPSSPSTTSPTKDPTPLPTQAPTPANDTPTTPSASPTAPTDYPTYDPTGSSSPTGTTSSPTPTPSTSTSSLAPTKFSTSPTKSPIPTKSPTVQKRCIAVPQDQLPEGQWATTDQQCQLCESGSHPWWPCDTNLCDCSGSPIPPAPPVQDPTPAPVNSPSAHNPNCEARSNQCSATNPCAEGCCSQWGYCGSTAGYCGDCCQSGNCWE